jgi:HlyD family secretion protein
MNGAADHDVNALATDRSLTADEQRRARLRGARPWLLGAAGLVVAYLVLRLVVTPSADRDDLRIARVEVGPVEAAIQVTGTVVPLLETVITSPAAARVVEVRHPAGDTVAAGETVVALDVAAEADAVRRAGDQVQIKRVAAREEELRLQQTLAGLQSQLRAARLDLAQAETRQTQQQGLFDRGLVTASDVRAAEVAVQKARLDVQRLDAEITSARALTTARLQSLDLDARVLETDRAQVARRLDAARRQVTRAGVVTWTVPQEGVAVGEGEPIARVADLSAFRVEASVPDLYAQQVRTGQAARVVVGDSVLAATVTGVRPAVQNGALTVVLALARPGHRVLRPSLRADVYIVTEARARALRVPRGPAFQGTGTQQAYVVRGNRLVRTPVTLGLSSLDYQEVVAGLSPGDEVVLSDTRDFGRARSVKLR